jgi:hypothetical protein
MPEHQNVPSAIQFDGGEQNDRLVQGVILKCVDGRWKAQDDTPLTDDMQFFVFGVTTGLQRWEDKRVAEEIKKKLGEPLPDVEELNSQIPQDTWDEGIDGKPRPPWQLNHIVYLLSVTDATKYTFLNATVGARIAADRLLDRITSMQLMRGPNVIPIVTLDSRPMKTAFGQKLRPDFKVIDWRGFAPAVLAQSPPHIGKPLASVTVKEEIGNN